MSQPSVARSPLLSSGAVEASPDPPATGSRLRIAACADNLPASVSVPSAPWQPEPVRPSHASNAVTAHVEPAKASASTPAASLQPGTASQPESALPAQDGAASGQGAGVPPLVVVAKQPPAPASAAAPQQQAQPAQEEPPPPPPTYEQRDALVQHVYKAARARQYQKWLTLLDFSWFASQHHLSPYSRLKFGSQGSRYAYLPLSVQHPSLVEDTLHKQEDNERRAADWLRMRRNRRAADRAAARAQVAARQQSPSACGVKRPHSDEAAEEVEGDGSHARSRPDGLEADMQDAMMQNIAPNGSGSSPTRPADAAPDATVVGTRSSTTGNGDAAPSAARDGSGVVVTGQLDREVVMTQEKERVSGMPQPEMSDSSAPPQSVASMPQEAQVALAMKTSDTHPINISLIVPPELLETISREVLPSLPSGLVEASASLTAQAKARDATAPAAVAEEESITPELHCRQQRDGLRLIRCGPSVDLCEKALEAETEAVRHAQAAARANGGVFPKNYEREPVAPHEPVTGAAADGRPGPRAIGNLLLSSCPGKKVRLTGPVRGRGAICRDLGLDLKRIHSLGVGAVVCCLDDEELAYLGAPWETYEREADQLGMDVVRLPMAEGFAPTCVKTIDMVMTSLVAEYTLQGRHVLVHCRGGVGRAGLIACVWMYKLGLVRSGALPFEQCPFELRPEYSAEHLAAVDRLVQTVRRRRSPKAIETAEQVAFLYEYVSYVSQQERLAQRASPDACA